MVSGSDGTDMDIAQKVGGMRDQAGLVGLIQSGSSPINVGGQHLYGDKWRSVDDQASMTATTTIDRLGDKMDRVAGQIHDLDKRVQRLEDAMELLKIEMRSSPGYSRAYLATGAGIMGMMLFLLLFLTWRML